MTRTASPAALNAVCPYYTMFPIEFPLRVLRGRARAGDYVADPFCGRGTTNFAGRILSLPTIGVDSSAVAVAVTRAKLAKARPQDVVAIGAHLLKGMPDEVQVPKGEFWELAYHPEVLRQVSWLREQLLLDCDSDRRILMRAIVMGALHGPMTKGNVSHLSNQCPRTYAPKPAYASRFWRASASLPPRVDVLRVIEARAHRYLAAQLPKVRSIVERGDSRNTRAWEGRRIRWIVTSPPYYGMRTYVADQWLRNWFVGGPAEVPYQRPGEELGHSSPLQFAADLSTVWRTLANSCHASAQLVIRFGGIRDRTADPVAIMKKALHDAGWRLRTIVGAGDATSGRRQAEQFLKRNSSPVAEHDYYAVLA